MANQLLVEHLLCRNRPDPIRNGSHRNDGALRFRRGRQGGLRDPLRHGGAVPQLQLHRRPESRRSLCEGVYRHVRNQPAEPGRIYGGHLRPGPILQLHRRIQRRRVRCDRIRHAGRMVHLLPPEGYDRRPPSKSLLERDGDSATRPSRNTTKSTEATRPSSSAANGRVLAP